MLGLFKRILSRTETPAAQPPAKATPAPRPGALPPPKPKPAAGPIKVSTPAVPRPAPAPAAAPRPTVAVTPPPGSSTHVQVALTSIAAGLPEAISHKVPAHPEQFVSVPVTTVLPQLGQGHVVMTAAELRDCAPDYFSALTGNDEVAITLPLAEIVQQLSPNHFARRSQRRVEVPNNVLPVFAADGKGFSIAAAPPAPAPTPVFRGQPTVTSTTPVPVATPAPTPATAPAGKISMSPQALAALNGGKAATPQVAPARPVGLAPQPQPAAPAPTPLPRTAPTPSVTPSVPAPAPRATTPAPKKSSNGLPKLTGELAIPLSAVCGGWVEEVRSQIQEVDATQVQILAPLELIEPAMKSGKVIFSWAEVASWIQPPLPIPPTAKVGEMPVELPLKAIAPLFMAHARTGAQKRAAVDESIPDLFGDANGKTNGSLQAQLPSTAAVADPLPPARSVKPAAPTNGMAAPRTVTPVALTQAPLAAPAVQEIAVETVIGPAEKRFSAKEVITNSSRLPGVAGALLAMTDGLLVTSQPSNVKGETIAAFLPQMFGRMNQYTKELTLGPLEQLTLTVESGQWHIIKAPNIYFAVLGKRGESLPLNLLAQVAAELSSQSK